MLNVNLTSAFLMSKAVYPAMKQGGGGKIVNIGSMTSIFGASFAAGLCHQQGRDRPAHQEPGPGLGGRQHPGQRDPARLVRHRVDRAGPRARSPACTNASWPGSPRADGPSPADMAGTAVWLASPASDYVTGVAIPVDGGYSSTL